MAKTKAKSIEDKYDEAFKRRYFFPLQGMSVEAKDHAEADEIVSKKLKEQEVGDDRA